MSSHQRYPMDLLELALTRCLLAYQAGDSFQDALEAGRMVLALESVDRTRPAGGLSPNSLLAGTGRPPK
ncbi:MAG: hypothetical protein GEU78_03370 [Actinobacteria bacterium]|nr:hypothetical protein [Actinomycetota bacterium]